MYPPIIVNLRGVKPADIIEVSSTLRSAGITQIDVPLIQKGAIEMLRYLCGNTPTDLTISVSSVIRQGDIREAAAAGATMINMPASQATLISTARRAGMQVCASAMTGQEAYAGLKSGAQSVMLYPAVVLGLEGFRIVRQNIPSEIRTYAAGGIEVGNIKDWLLAGATGFGFGSVVYSPRYTVKEIETRARTLVSELTASCKMISGETLQTSTEKA